MKLTTELHLMARLRMSGVISLGCSIRFHGVEKDVFALRQQYLLHNTAVSEQRPFRFNLPVRPDVCYVCCGDQSLSDSRCECTQTVLCISKGTKCLREGTLLPGLRVPLLKSSKSISRSIAIARGDISHEATKITRFIKPNVFGS